MAGNQTATVTTANGVAKRVHGAINDLVPDKNLKVLNRIPYDKETQLGSEYAELVYLTGEHGITYGGSSGAKRTLNSSEVAVSKLATMTPSTLYFRSEVVIDLLSRAQQGGEKAFESYLAALMRNSKKAIQKRLEIRANYGGASLATISAATDANTSSVITITTATWAPHIWLSSIGCPLDAYDGATQKNTNAALYVTAVNMADKKVTVTGNSTDIDAIIAVGTNGSGVELYFRGQYGLDGTGIRTVANLTSGSYLGITSTDFPDVWNGTQVTWDQSTEDFTWVTLQEGLEEAASRGFEGDAICQVPFPVWNQLNNSLDALRVFDSSYSVNKTEMGRGVDSITYHAITGKVTIEVSGFQRYGEVMVYPDNSGDTKVRARRIGSTDVTFMVPGRGDEMFRLVEDSNTVEYRAFTDQDLWLPAPRSCVLFAP